MARLRISTAEVETRIEQLFDFIVSYKREHDGIAPSLRDMAEHMGITSTSHIAYFLRKLAKSGRIVIIPHLGRHISIPGGSWQYTPPAS